MENIEKVNNIKQKLHFGDITYEEAREMIQPIIEEIYEKQKVIAKKYNRKAVKLSASSLLR